MRVVKKAVWTTVSTSSSVNASTSRWSAPGR